MIDGLQFLSLFAAIAAAITGVGHAIAAVIREHYRGRMLLMLAERNQIRLTTDASHADYKAIDNIDDG